MAEFISLSVLIVNWKSKDFLRRCLETLRETCSEIRPQIVVVDGGSFDGCADMLAADFPEIKFIQSKDNLGFGRSNNLGFRYITGESVLLLNPDTELKPGAVQSLLYELQCHPDAGIMGPRLLNSDGSLQTSCVRALPTPLNRALDSDLLRRLVPNSPLWGVGRAFQAAESVAVEAVSGACMLLRTDIYRQLGGFSPEFFMYGEDMDLCAKTRKLGLRVYYVPQSVVIHHGSGSSSTEVSHFSTVMMCTSGAIYMRLNHGVGAALRYRLLLVISALIRLTLLLPACLLLAGTSRTSAQNSFVKWVYVTRWAIGFSSIRPPVLAASGIPSRLMPDGTSVP